MRSANVKQAARKVMVDNVATMVIESTLVQSLPKLLTTTTIVTMEDTRLSSIASEAEGAQEERDLANQKLEALEEALQICSQYASQPMPGMFSFPPFISIPEYVRLEL